MEVNPKSRVSIYFDMDTHKLEDALGKSWRNAYSDIRTHMEKNDFEHEQGSVYHSNSERGYMDVVNVIQELAEENQWFSDCVRKISFARISDEHDLLPVLENGQLSFKFEMENEFQLDPDILEKWGFTNKKTMSKQNQKNKGFDFEL